MSNRSFFLQTLRPFILLCYPRFDDASREVQRRVLLVIAGALLATITVIPVVLLLLSLGSTANAVYSALTFIPMALTLLVLRFSQSTTIAGNYLTFTVMVAVLADLGPDNGFSVLAMLAIPIIATHLVGAKTGICWTAITVGVLLVVGQDMADKGAINGNELAITAAIITAIIGIGATIIEYTLSSESNRSLISANRLQAQQEKLRHFLSETFQGFLEIDNEQVIYESHGIGRLAEQKLGSLRGQTLPELIHPDDYKQLRNQMQSSAPNGFRQELRVRDVNGQWAWLELYAISEQFDDNWLFAIRDFASEHESRRRRENNDRLQSVGLLAAGIAHDFNNLLTVVVGFSEQFPDSQEKRHVIEAATRASELANRLVIFGKPDPGKTAPIDLTRLITNLAPLLTSVLGEEVNFHCDLELPSAWVVGNESQLQQILLNIFNNAKDAMPTGGEFYLNLSSETLIDTNKYEVPAGEYVILELVDTGQGMEEEILNRIFDPYYSTKSQGAGRGLGLSSVYATINHHQGGITISSESGRGTQISIALPEKPRPAESDSKGSTRPPSRIQEQASVLVVEDEEMIRTLIKRALESNGYQVTLAEDGIDGIKCFESMTPPPSILITDVVMPEMRGSELARRLRQSAPDLLVLFVSGYSAMEIGQSDLDAENTGFLAKPFRMTQLVERLEQLQLASEPRSTLLTPSEESDHT